MVATLGCFRAGGRLRFPNKPPNPVWVGSQLCRQDLQSNGAIEPGILGEVDFSHSPHTQQGMNLVGADLPPYQRLGSILGHTLGRHLQGGRFNEALSLVLDGEQRFDFPAQNLVARTRFF